MHPPRDAAVARRCRSLVEGYVEHYNNVRLNSAIGYITPKDMLAGHQQEIHAERDRKLEAASEQRKNRRKRAARRMKQITNGMVRRFRFADHPTGTAVCNFPERLTVWARELDMGPLEITALESNGSSSSAPTWRGTSEPVGARGPR